MLFSRFNENHVHVVLCVLFLIVFVPINKKNTHLH